jgi:hypothetical protein
MVHATVSGQKALIFNQNTADSKDAAFQKKNSPRAQYVAKNMSAMNIRFAVVSRFRERIRIPRPKVMKAEARQISCSMRAGIVIAGSPDPQGSGGAGNGGSRLVKYFRITDNLLAVRPGRKGWCGFY